MTGQWIWLDDNISTENERGCFAESLHIDNKNYRVLLNISADTRYIAYVNGEEISRGPIRSTADNWYYDEVDITPYVKCGSNHFAVRVWNYGWSTYQSVASAGGLVYEVVQGGRVIAASGAHTKCTRDIGHRYNTVKRNVNLGFTDYYDARKFDPGWLEDSELTDSWGYAKLIRNIWGELQKRPIKPFHSEERFAQRLVEYSEVKKGCQQLSLNTRKAFFADRKDANETIMAGFIGFIIDSPCDMDGRIAFPNRLWTGVFGFFKVDETVYEASNTCREVAVHLKKGTQLFLLQVSGKHDDLYCHMEFKFPEELKFALIDKDSGSSFFVIGPTDRVTGKIDGISRIYGGLDKFEGMEPHTELHRRIFACQNQSELLEYKQYLKYIEPEYVFFDEYVLSLAKNEIPVRKYSITNDVCGILWNNSIPTVIPRPSKGDYSRLIVDFGDIYAGSLEFSLKASEGTVLDIYCFENMFGGEVDYTVGLNNAVRYICCEGYQSYRCMTRMGCRFAMITVRNQVSNVELQSLRIRHSTLAPTNIGTFRCSDSLLNKIWEISRQTHLLCMEDAFTDCPTFEQAFWIGDAQISAFVNAYLFGEYDLIRHNLLLAVSASKNTPLMNALTPTDWNVAIPMWMMNWVISADFYVKITDDRNLIKELYPHLKETLNYYAGFIDEKGGFLINSWNLLDWAAIDIHNHGIVTGQQAVLAYCFRIAARFADEMGYSHDAGEYRRINDRLLQYIDRYLWEDYSKTFTDGWSPEFGYSKTVSIQTHALLMFFDGITDSDKRRIVEQYLAQPPEYFLKAGSPFILFHLYELWAQRGKTGQALEDMRVRWSNMLRYDSTTCWESFPGFHENARTRSYCHSWSSSPVYFLSKYILGVFIEADGFRKVRISPPDTELEWCEGSIPTPLGMLQIRWSRENNRKSCFVSVPAGVDIAVAEASGWEITVEKLDEQANI